MPQRGKSVLLHWWDHASGPVYEPEN